MPRQFAAPLLLATCFLAPIAAADCVQTVRRNPDPSASVRTADGQLTGVRLSLTVEALRRMGCRAVVKDLPWSRALTDLAHGELDVLPATHRKPEREAFALFSTRLTPALLRAYLRRGVTQPPEDLDALQRSGLKLGLQSGVVYGASLERHLADPAFAARVERAVTRTSLWRMLARGRVDVVLAEDFSAVWELEQLGLSDKVQASALIVEGEATSTAFSRDRHDADFVARFDAALAEMARDGTEQAIVARLREAQQAQPRR